MEITRGSSFEYQAALEWSVPNRWAPQLRADLTELQLRRAQQPTAVDPELERLRAEVQRLTPDDAHARQCRTEKLELPISNAVESIRARLDAMHQVFRISAVLDHLRIKRDLYGITKLPTRAVVQRVLVKHGLYVIGL